MSDFLSSLVVKISADMADLKSGMDRAVSTVENANRQMSGAFKNIESQIAAVDNQLGAFGTSLRTLFGLAAAGGFAALVKGSIDAAAKIHDLSMTTGIAADQFAAMRVAAAESGASLDQVAQLSVRLSKAIETQDEESSKAAKALGAMGLSMEELKGKMPAEQLLAVSKRLNEYADGSGKAAAATVLFGKSGADAIPFLRALGEQGLKTTEGYAKFTAQADEFQDALARLQVSSQDISAVYASQLLPALVGIVNGFEAMNAQKSPTLGFVDVVGEGLRVLSLGVVTVWSALKEFVVLLHGGAKIALASLKGDMLGVAEAAKEISEKTAANGTALLAFSDKVLAGSKVFGDAANNVAQVGNAAAASKPKLDLMATSLKATADALALVEKATKDLTAVMDFLNGVDTTHVQRQAALVTAYQQRVITAEQYMAAVDRLNKTSKEAVALENARTAAAKAGQAAQERQVAAVVAFHDNLQKQLKTLGLSAEAVALLEARELKLGDTEDANIARLFTRKSALEDEQRVLSAAAAEWAGYGAAAARAVGINNDVLNDWDEGNKKLEQYIKTLGLTQAAVERLAAEEKYRADRLKAFAIEDEQMQRNQLAVLERQFQERLRLIDSKELRQAYLDNAAAASKAAEQSAASMTKSYEDLARGIQSSITDALVGAFDKGGDIVKTFVDWLKQMFMKLVLRPIIEPIAGSITGMLLQGFGGGGAGAFGAGGGASSYGSLLSAASGLYDGAGKAMSWLTGTTDVGGGLTSVNGVLQPVQVGTNGFWSTSGSFGSTATAGGVLGTAALGALAGSIIAPYISEDEDASRNGAIGGAAGSVIGAYVATGTAVGGPWGAVIGAVVGILAAAFSDVDGPAMRTAAVVAGETMDKYTYSLRSKLGTLGILEGSDKWFSDSDMGETLTTWFKVIEDIDNSIADRLSSTQLAAAQAAVGSGTMNLGFGIEHQEIDPAAFGHIAQDRYVKIFGAIDESMGKLIAGFEGTTGDLLKLVDDLAAVNYQLTQNGESLARLIGESIKFDDIERLNAEGETYAQTLARIGQVYFATNAIAVMFAKTQEEVWGAVGLASEAAREALVRTVGGIDKLTASLGSYYQHYFTAAERLQHTHEQLAGVFDGLGFTMPTTLRGFRDLIEGLDLTTESGRSMFAALIEIEDEFYDLVTAAGQAGDEMEKLSKTLVGMGGTGTLPGMGGGLPGTIRFPVPMLPSPYVDEYGRIIGPGTPTGDLPDDFNDLAAAAIEAHLRIVELTQSINESFRDAYRSIELAGLSNQQQYEYLQKEAAGFFANLQSSSSAEEAQKWADKITRDMLAAFNLLSSEEQNNQRSTFLTNLTKLNDDVTSIVNRHDPLYGEGVTPAQATAETNSQAASKTFEAAGRILQAADKFEEVVAGFAMAQGIPKRFHLVLPDGGAVEAGT